MLNGSSNELQPERVFVTGGLGFIGAYVVRRLLDQGNEVMIYDHFKSYVSPMVNRLYPLYMTKRAQMLGGRAEIVEGDIRDFPHLRSAVHRFQPAKIIHLAGLPIADKSDSYPHEAVSVNYVGTVNVLDACRELHSFKKFINISSSMVYGDFKTRPCPEDHPLHPKGVYGATKLGAEVMTRIYAERYGFDYINLRPSSVYGPTDCNQRVTQLFVERALAGQPLILHNGGRSELDFTHVEDVADGIVLTTKRDDVRNETFNLTRGEGRTLAELAAIIKSHIPSAKIEHRELAQDERRPERGAMDISKARAILGYNPIYSLDGGMADYIKFVMKVIN